MAINSCQKGKIGERQWRDELRAAGFTSARRGQQFSGSPDSPDVVCPELSHLHFECKRVEKLNVLDAMLQAIRDAGTKTPVLAHRRNRGEWLVTMRAADWFKLLREALPAPKEVGATGEMFCKCCRAVSWRGCKSPNICRKCGVVGSLILVRLNRQSDTVQDCENGQAVEPADPYDITGHAGTWTNAEPTPAAIRIQSPGWRYLDPGEIIKDTDEAAYSFANGGWERVPHCNGGKVEELSDKLFRRAICLTT